MALLGSKEYWDARYSLDPQPFDWYQRLASCAPFRDLLLKQLDQDKDDAASSAPAAADKRAAAAAAAAEKPRKPASASQILIVGAGSSRLAEELWAENFRHLYNIDFSSVCIGQLNERYAKLGLKPMQNTVMDVRSMDFNDGSFDAVLDKATLDSMLCSDAGGEESVGRLLSEVARVLKEGGVFLLLSNAPPERRMPMLEAAEYGWKVAAHAISKPGTASTAASVTVAMQASGSSSHFLYVATKEDRTYSEAAAS